MEELASVTEEKKTFGTTAEFAGLAARLLHVGIGQVLAQMRHVFVSSFYFLFFVSIFCFVFFYLFFVFVLFFLLK